MTINDHPIYNIDNEKIISDNEIMTAEEINQLLIDRDIVLLFNENIPCSAHDKTVKLLEKALKDEAEDYEFKEHHLYQKEGVTHTITEDIYSFISSILTICNDIKNTDAHNQTILFNNGFIDLFVNLIGKSSFIPPYLLY